MYSGIERHYTVDFAAVYLPAVHAGRQFSEKSVPKFPKEREIFEQTMAPYGILEQQTCS